MQSLERSDVRWAAVVVIWFPFAWVSAIELCLHSHGVCDNQMEYEMSPSEEMGWIGERMARITIAAVCTAVYVAMWKGKRVSPQRVLPVEAVLSWVFQVVVTVAASRPAI